MPLIPALWISDFEPRTAKGYTEKLCLEKQNNDNNILWEHGVIDTICEWDGYGIIKCQNTVQQWSPMRIQSACEKTPNKTKHKTPPNNNNNN